MEADLSAARFHRTVLTQALFVGAKAQGAQFVAADLYQTNWAGALLAGARLTDCELTYADFSHADLSGADLRGATMFRANLHAVIDADAQFSDRARALESEPELMAAEGWRAQPVAAASSS